MSNKNRHRYKAYELDAIRAVTVAKMVKGKLGQLPTKGDRGQRTPDGGFYARVNADISRVYGHPVGHGTINKWRKEALIIQKKQEPTKSIKRPSTVTTTTKLKRLTRTAVLAVMTPPERGFARSLRAYHEETPLTGSQLKKLDSLYQDIYINRYKKNK